MPKTKVSKQLDKQLDTFYEQAQVVRQVLEQYKLMEIPINAVHDEITKLQEAHSAITITMLGEITELYNELRKVRAEGNLHELGFGN